MFGYFQHDLCKGLERNDFIHFAAEFTRVINDNIPTIEELTFIDPPQPQPAAALSETTVEKEFRLDIEKAVHEGTPTVSGDRLILPFPVDGATIVAQATGLDAYLVRQIGNDWLDGLCTLLVREFLLVKRACIDSLTGLFSSLHLEEHLDSINTKRTGVLILLSVYPKSSNAFLAKKYQHRTVSLLKAFVAGRFPLYYLGQSCFGILCEQNKPDFVSEFAPSLVNYFKRGGSHRVHVSSAAFGDHLVNEDSSILPSEAVLKKAWAALHVATKRGPFAFCNYNSIEESVDHPLAPPAQSLVRWVQKETRQVDVFSLFQFNSNESLLVESIQECVGDQGQQYDTAEAIFLLIPGQDRKMALKTGDNILQHYNRRNKKTATVNCGIALFPSGDFRKSEVILNCRKALLHSDFLDPGALVICNALSCNVAGDMYYGDGNLVLAVKEYRRGLLLDPDDGNVLNSLGVCYAQMNKHTFAVECFRKACKSKDDKFMALYNLGLEYQIRQEQIPAIQSFSEALSLLEEDGEGRARKDIRFQLAVLCIEQHRYKKGLELLEAWYKTEEQYGMGGKALRYLGESYSGLGRYREAMKYLQRAMRYDEYDAEVLSLLGEMYLRENEGDDIALRFCEKAVELNPEGLNLQLRLATAQIHCGDFTRGGRTLKPCLRNRKLRPAALVQKGLLALGQGKTKVAEKWFVKAMSCPGGENNPSIQKSARGYLNKISK